MEREASTKAGVRLMGRLIGRQGSKRYRREPRPNPFFDDFVTFATEVKDITLEEVQAVGLRNLDARWTGPSPWSGGTSSC